MGSKAWNVLGAAETEQPMTSSGAFGSFRNKSFNAVTGNSVIIAASLPGLLQ